MLSCRVFWSTLSSCLAASHHPLGFSVNSPNPFTINTYKNCFSNSFRMNTYRKTGEGGSPTPTLVHRSFALSFTLLPRAVTQLFSFQASAHSLLKNAGVYPHYSLPRGLSARGQTGTRPSPPICPLPTLPKRAKIPAPLYPERTVRGAKGACRPGFLL